MVSYLKDSDSAKIHPIAKWAIPNTGWNSVVIKSNVAVIKLNFLFDWRYKILKIMPSPYANVLGAINEWLSILRHPKGVKKLSKENVFIFKLINISSKTLCR